MARNLDLPLVGRSKNAEHFSGGGPARMKSPTRNLSATLRDFDLPTRGRLFELQGAGILFIRISSTHESESCRPLRAELLRPAAGARLSRLHRGGGALFLLRHDLAARALYERGAVPAGPRRAYRGVRGVSRRRRGGVRA